MFVFTGHRGPGRCRRSKNKSSTDFWSFVWRISPQYFWHIFTFACFCFTELATQQMLFSLRLRPIGQKHKSLVFKDSNHSFAWGVISAYSDFSFSIETLDRFPEKEIIITYFSILIFHLIPILNSQRSIPQQISIISIPVSQLKILNSCSEFPIETLGRFPENQIAKSRMTRLREI